MSVTTTATKAQYNGDAATSVFPVTTFKIYAASEIVVSIKNNTAAAIAGIAAYTVKTLTLTTDYTVALGGSASGVAYTFTVTVVNTLYTSLPVGLILVIQRVEPLTQLTSYADNAKTPAATYQQCFDRAVMLIQQLQEVLNRSLAFDVTQSTAPTLPVLAAGALYCDGAALAWQAITTTASTFGGSLKSGADALKAASPGLGDLYFATDTRKIYLCSTTSVWSTQFNFADVQNFAKSTDIASATTCDIGAATGNFVHVTGTVTITGFGTVQAGAVRYVEFTGALLLTHNATTLILPGAANITTAAGDCGIFISEGSGNWRCVSYNKASGLSPVAPNFQTAASQSEMEAASSNTVPVTPLSQKWHPGMAKAWLSMNGTGTIAILASHNIASIVDDGTGTYTINFTTAFSSANYCVVATATDNAGTAYIVCPHTYAVGSVKIKVMTTAGYVNTDVAIICLTVFGDQ